jgi:hypothetical protein
MDVLFLTLKMMEESLKKRRSMLWVIGLLFAPAQSIHGEDQSPLKLVQKIPVPNVKGRLDHFTLDLEGSRLFVADLGDDQNTVEVIDLKMGKRVFSVLGQSKPQGLFYSPDVKELFVANRSDGTCKI